MSNETIPPALTADEWAASGCERGTVTAATYGPGVFVNYVAASHAGVLLGPDAVHAVMALANDALLEGDPRKITREDVEALQEARDRLSQGAPRFGDLAAAGALLHLQRRIAALLPPEGT